MVRFSSLLIYFSLSYVLNAQIQSTWIGDPSKIFYTTWQTDTTYHMRHEFAAGNWMIYYDQNHVHKYSHHIIIKDSLWTDTIWYSNGNLKYTGYASVNSQSEMRCWYPDGVLKEASLSGLEFDSTWTYYPSGKLESLVLVGDFTFYRGGRSTIYFEGHYENGQPKYDSHYITGFPQLIYMYYESGKKMGASTHQGGGCVGADTAWYESGQIKVLGQYKEYPVDLITVVNTIRIGTWSYYNESGALIKEEFYEEGKLVKTVEH